MTGPLYGKTALVTGGGKGIGLAIAVSFAKAGADVIIAGRNAPVLDRAVDTIDRAGRHRAATAVAADVTDEKQVDRIFAAIRARGAPLEILVCNAGINPNRKRGVEEIALADWDAVFATNLRAAFLCCRAALPLMRPASCGRIVFVNSIAGRTTPDRCSPAYRASKHGLRSLATTLAKDLASTSIRVSSVLPGTVATDMIDPSYAPDGPLLAPDDVAEAVLFLVTRPNEVVVPEIVIAPRYEIVSSSSPYV